MEPKYSILLCNQSLWAYKGQIQCWLQAGIKVLWFGSEQEEMELKSEYPEFAKAFLLQVYSVNISDKTVVIDGNDKENMIPILEKACLKFNGAQYRVEHCMPQEHIVVQASAGTGKTKVMVDRIMYLMHTVTDLQMSEIYMITFTNDAADQMNKRLQDVLVERYRLTRLQRYLCWMEQQSQMNISTIHSFAYSMLKEYGINEGFTRNLAIRSFKYEKDELIKDKIDSYTVDEKPVIEQLGVTFYRAKDIVRNFWNGISRSGISHEALRKMDWGEPVDERSEPFQRIITELAGELDKEYFDIKRQNEAVGIDDIMRDLQEILSKKNLPEADISMKYLFIDEFQDSDLSQIKVACFMVRLLGAVLFVVGDVKQSIYRFRGATDQAFFILKREMEETGIKPPSEYTLQNNYRTAAGVLNRMDGFFKCWGKMGKLQYEKPVIPFNGKSGTMTMVYGERKEFLEDQIGAVVSHEWERLNEKLRISGKAPTEKDRVVVLVRTNKELGIVENILRKRKIPVSVQADGSFYASEAVVDFYMMVSSFMFPDEPKYIFNYLLTPYAGEIDPMDMNILERMNGNQDNLVDYLDHYLEQTRWKYYHRELRLRPVMSVFKEILDSGYVVEHFIENYKSRKMAEGWTLERCNAATRDAARRYQANLEKLMELLQRNMGGDKVSLYDIYKFLKLNVTTNKDEGEAMLLSADSYNSVLCMTVHKSKGLEFDTVIVPFTNKRFPTWEQTEVVIDSVNRQVGWNYTGDAEMKKRRKKYPSMKNNLYCELKANEIKNICKEECRILYVAMTRAINTLICVVPDFDSEQTWAYLIMEAGDIDYE